MDNTGDERREGASRFSPAKRQIIKQSGMVDNGGEYVFVCKSKKQKLRRLSIVGTVSSRKEGSEMGFVGSDGEDEINHTTSTSKRFKVPRKLFDDCNPVDHASVPRKLRSAMKKRNHESGSPPFPDKKKPNFGVNGVELSTKDAINRTKPNQQQDLEGSSSLKIVGPITKDEEEVVETLYALAVMFPFSTNKKNNLDCELENAKSSALLQGESSKPVLEDSAAPEKEEDSVPLCPSTVPVAVNPSLLEGSDLETAKVKFSIEPSKPGLPNSAQSYTELDCIISQSNVQSMPLLSESKLTDGKLFCSSVDCNVQSELSLETGCREPKHDEATAYAGAPAAAVGCQHELHDSLKESKKSGSALWPGLSSADSPGDGTQRTSSQSCGANKPTTLTGLLDTGVLTEKDSRGSIIRKNSWKRCSAHVCISHLIKDLQNAERKDILPAQPTSLTPNEGTNQGIHLVANNMNCMQSGLNGAFSAADKNSTEVRNAILLHKRLVQDQLQPSTSSVLYTTQKRSFDFLPLSAVCDPAEATYTAISNNKVGNGLEPLTSFHTPYMQPLAQNQRVLQSLCLPQNRFSSSFADNLPAAAAKQVQMQPSPYTASPLLGPPHLDSSSSQKQQHQIWTAQWGPQYKQPMGVAESHIPSWQNGRQDPSAINHTQSILQLPNSSLEVLGPRHTTFPQQQQYISLTTSSLPTARLRRQHNYFLPTGFHGNGVGPSPDNTTTAFPLQFPLPLGQSVTYTL